MRIAFKTFGCKTNSVETDSLYCEAKRRGLEIVGDSDFADAYIINSCTVTHSADRDTRNQVSRFKCINPEALIAVVGCYPQVTKEELLRMPEINFVVGTADKPKVLDYFTELWNGASIARDHVTPPSGFLNETFPGSRHARPSVKIQDGCNFRCSYCIISKARGRSQSLEPQKVLAQLNDAYSQGFQEIILTGIHIAHYGWDLGTNLMELLKKILQEPKGPRIRLSTLDPFEIEDELIEMLGIEPRLCPHLHIGLQSGSNKILSKMRREYKAEEFIEVTQKIHKHSPLCFVGADVIVGFPGESNEDFEQTLDCLSKSFWTKLHVFSFSPRKDTPAALMENQVKNSEITERSKLLRMRSDKRYLNFMNSQIGKTFDVVLEKPSKKISGFWQGHTENYLPTYSKALACHKSRQIVRSRVTKIEQTRLWTEPLN